MKTILSIILLTFFSSFAAASPLSESLVSFAKQNNFPLKTSQGQTDKTLTVYSLSNIPCSAYFKLSQILKKTPNFSLQLLTAPQNSTLCSVDISSSDNFNSPIPTDYLDVQEKLFSQQAKVEKILLSDQNLKLDARADSPLTLAGYIKFLQSFPILTFVKLDSPGHDVGGVWKMSLSVSQEKNPAFTPLKIDPVTMAIEFALKKIGIWEKMESVDQKEINLPNSTPPISKDEYDIHITNPSPVQIKDFLTLLQKTFPDISFNTEKLEGTTVVKVFFPRKNP